MRMIVFCAVAAAGISATFGGVEPRTVALDLPSGSHDAVTGQAFSGHVMASLAPWEMRSFKR